MKTYLKAVVVSLALVVSGVLVSPSAQVQIQRGWNVVSGYMDIVGSSATYKWVVSGTSLLLQSSTGGAFSTVGTFTSGGNFTIAGAFTSLMGNIQTAGAILNANGANIYFPTGSGIGFRNNGNTNTYDITLADWGTTLSAEGVSVANAGLLFLGAAPFGTLEIQTGTDNRICRFELVGTSNATAEERDGGNICSAVQGTATSINVYYDAAGSSGAGYYLQNNRGGTRTVRLVLIGA